MSDQPHFNPHCNSNTSSAFYACDYGTRFLGCCGDGTGNEICASGCVDVQSATFDKHYYSSIPKNDCNSTEGQWYTCADTSPPFMGCCRSNPCAGNGCPQNDLVAARLSMDQKQKEAFSAFFITEPLVPQSHTGAIVGGAVGGLAIIVIVTCSLLWYRRRRSRNRGVHSSNDQKNSEGINVFIPLLPPKS